MKTLWRSLFLLLPALLGGCFAEPPEECPPGATTTGGTATDLVPEAGATGAPPYAGACPPGVVLRSAPETAACRAADTAEPLPQRDVVSDREAAAVDISYFTSDLFATFKANCGSCHLEAASGGLLIKTSADFASLFNQEVLDVIKSDDPTKYMPPPGSGGKPWSKRHAGDPVFDFVQLVELWLQAGSPPDFFTQPAEAGAVSRYFMETDLAQGLTNLGNCIPDPDLVNAVQESDCEIDQRFAEMKKIESPEPATPEQRLGLPRNLEQTDLLSFDSAELARHHVIAFAPSYPLWSDDAGKLRHVRVPIGESIKFNKKTQEFTIPENTRFYKTFMKKITDKNGNERWKKIETRLIVSRKDNPLFGTYLWDENETRAELLRDALRNGEPFRDRLLLVVTDEKKGAEIRAKKPRNLTFELQRAGALRHYAVPGQARCVQCHMGSHSSSFILGFTPMDILRRPLGEGGVLLPAGPDELTQLDRLVDYGVITGVDSAADITLLENSQGDRKPRNEHELSAQAYMFGNCAHCHNPNGFPSHQAPELAPLLNFFPSPEGGIFQFPLERFSPRLHRGIEGDVELPYITPSLYDITPDDRLFWKPKAVARYGATAKTGTVPVDYLEAPWRSLIWRNTDTPFPYSEDYTIFPHMPMNTPGFDCRAPQLMGDWMVSIPSVRKDQTTWEEYVDFTVDTGVVLNIPGPPNRESQPWREVKPGEPGYDKAVAAAKTRFDKWRKGNRYSRCPDTSDIVDQKVLDGQRLVPIDGEIYALKEFIEDDSVPDRPHWIETDLTELPPPWYPRRLDWKDLIVDGKFPTLDHSSLNYDADVAKQAEQRNVIDLIQHVDLTDDFRTFLTTPIPFGLWAEKPECDFSQVPKLGELASPPAWATDAMPPESPVYVSTRGAAVYGTICINCHGPNADSQGIQAQKVAELTGGNTRVANFVTGLFGPPEDTFANRQRIFSEQSVVPPDTMAARYMAFMGLGGTQREIPRPVLNLVAQTQVLGVKRPLLAISVSANMLAVAEELCRAVLSPAANVAFGKLKIENTNDTKTGPLIHQNGDEALWKELCAYGNSRMVRAVVFNGKTLSYFPYSFYSADAYPLDAPVGTEGDVEAALSPGNSIPWCIVPSTDPKTHEEERAVFIQSHPWVSLPPPFCPQQVLNSPLLDHPTIDNWAKRGAINAGFAVYTYVDSLAKGKAQRIRYNECELLGK